MCIVFVSGSGFNCLALLDATREQLSKFQLRYDTRQRTPECFHLFKAPVDPGLHKTVHYSPQSFIISACVEACEGLGSFAKMLSVRTGNRNAAAQESPTNSNSDSRALMPSVHT